MRIPILILLIFLTIDLSAQPALLKAPQHAAQDLVFRLTGEQAKTIFSTKETPEFDYQYLGQLIDSIPYGKPLPDTFSNGHYLRLSLVKDRVETEIYTIQPFQLHLLNNARDFSLQLTDSSGQIIPNARVKVNHRKVRFDETSQTYRLKKSNQQGLLSISWSGQTYYYQVDRTYNRSFLNRLGKGYIQYGLVRYLWRPVRFAVALPVESVQSLIQNYPTYRVRQTGSFFSRLYYKIACIFDSYYCDSYGRSSPQYEGFLLTDKPIYRPGDTLCWKAYLLKRRNGKPFQKPIELQLHNLGELRWSSGEQTPQSPGNYHGYLVLEDSLNLRLDSYLSFQLTHKEESLIYSSVRYEDYELGRSQLSARALKNKVYRGDSIQFEVSALDENARPLVGAELKVLLLSKQLEKPLSNRLFLPDTLWEHSLFLKAEKNTPIKFPTTDFPPANFAVTAHFELLSADNERLTEQLDLQFYAEERLVSYTIDADTIHFHLEDNGQSMRDTLTILTRDQAGKVLQHEVIALPMKWPLQPQVWDYTFEQKNWKNQLRLKQEEARLQFTTNRQDKEVSIKASNPHRLPFHYFFYELDKEIARGYTTNLDTIWEADIQKNTYFAVQYLWRGEIIEHNYEISGQSDGLEISWSIPTQVEPGEQVPISLSVKDESGKPRADVDLSLFALTSKFQDYQLPDIPDHTKALRKRIVFNSFRLLPKPQNLASTSLNYEFWQTLTDLDQNLYYQFRVPQDTIYQFSYPAQDSITQFAPFIDGQAVYIIEVDNSPVFFNWTTNEQPYSFRIGAGSHHIRLRLREKWVDLGQVSFPKGYKTILNARESYLLANQQVEEAKIYLSKDEKQRYRPFLMPYRSLAYPDYSYLRQREQYVTALEASKVEYHHLGLNVAGPVYRGKTTFRALQKFELNFDYQPGYEYDFEPELLKMIGPVEDKRIFPNILTESPRNTYLGAEVQTQADLLKKWKVEQLEKLRQQTNLLVFEVLSQDSSRYEFARSVLDYLLRQSRVGNTYDQARLVFLAVPFLRKHKEEIDQGKVKIGQLELASLPYVVSWPQDSTLTLTKKGDGNIYLSATQSYSEPDPKPRDSIFTIHTEFSSFSDTLQAGKPVRFQVLLKVKKEADYVQLTVPIPAGCSYNQQSGFAYPAVHTEFYRDKVVCFFKKLPVGDYAFQINLLPRYTGRYQVNPANAKLMYFPVVNGNNVGKTINIQ